MKHSVLFMNYNYLINKKMKTFIYLVLLIQIPFSLNSQTFKVSGKVTDSETKEGLPFTNVMVFGYSIGTTSDKEGHFELILDDSLKNKTLVFSFVGYNSVKMGINNIGTMPILLTPQQYEIGEVIVRATKRKEKPLIINKFREQDCMLRYSTSPFDSVGNLNIPYRPIEPTIEAMYFPYNSDFDEQSRLKEIWLYVSNFRLSQSLFRLRIFDTKEDKTPGNDLITTPLNIEVLGKDKIVKVNVEEYNISIQKQGLFIGFELLIMPENMQTIENELGKKATIYSPFLRQIHTKNIGEYWIYTKGEWIVSKYWYYDRGKWFMSDNKDLKARNTSSAMLFKPAISIILTD